MKLNTSQIRRFVLCLCLAAFFVCSPKKAKAQLVIYDTIPAVDLLTSLFGGGVIIDSLRPLCDSITIGYFDGSNSNIGLPSGVIIATGNINNAPGPNIDTGAGDDLLQPGDPILDSISGFQTFDACGFEFDMIPLCDTIGINYVFASEEYPEFVGASFNDLFAFLISGPGFNGVQNIATLPGTNIPVSIDNVNDFTNSGFYVDNSFGTTVEYDGFTVPLLAQVAVTPCSTYRVKIIIADAGDGILDSSVFLEEGGIECLGDIVELDALTDFGGLGNDTTMEACVSGSFVFTRGGNTVTADTFIVTIGGTATPGIDYTPLSDTIIFPAGVDTISIPLTLVDDGNPEPVEYIEIVYLDTALCGGTFADTARLYIADPGSADAGPDKGICSGQQSQLGSAHLPAVTYSWTPTTGLSEGTVARPFVTLTNTSDTVFTQEYILTVDGGVCSWQDTVYVDVYPEIQADFTGTNVCLGNTTTFLDASSPPSLTNSWAWDFGDTNADATQSPTHTYTADGTYTVELVAANIHGCVDTIEKSVTVFPEVVAAFSFTDACFGDASVFTDESTSNGTINQWQWDFDNGTTASVQNPSHTYASEGTYDVSLIATNTDGCSDTVIQPLTILATHVAAFSVSITCDGFPMSFTNETNPMSPGMTWVWDFNDGNTSAEQDPSNVFPNAGIHSVNMTATNANGCIAVVQQDVEVYSLPDAQFDAEAVCLTNNMPFVSTATVAAPSEIDRYFWDFGDGEAEGSREAWFLFEEPGQFPVRHRVISNHGCEDTLTELVTIHPSPEPGFLTNNVCFEDTAWFTDRSDIAWGEVSAWSWDFGDGNVSFFQDPFHVYDAPGDYEVTLTAYSDQGCPWSRTKEITIYAIPEFGIVKGDSICLGGNAFLSALPSDGGEVSWYWGLTDDIPVETGISYVTPNLVQSQNYYVEVSRNGCLSGRIPVLAAVYPGEDAEIITSDSIKELPQAIIEFLVASSEEIESYEWDFGDGETSVVENPSHEYQHPGVYTVNVQTVDVHGCELNLFNEVEIKQILGLYIPSGFTPNGDAINDEFKVGHGLMIQFQVQIFDRWGKMVYESDSPDFRWNGIDSKGRVLPDGVYVYKISAVGYNGNRYDKSGTVTIIR